MYDYDEVIYDYDDEEVVEMEVTEIDYTKWLINDKEFDFMGGKTIPAHLKHWNHLWFKLA